MLSRLLILPEHNCTQVADWQRKGEINRLQNLGNKDMPDGHAKREVEGTGDL